MGFSLGIDENFDYLKFLLNFYLNERRSNPYTDWRFIFSHDAEAKLAVFDFDGIFEKVGEPELYRQVIAKMANKNSAIRENLPKLGKWIKALQTPGNYKLAVENVTNIFVDCKLTKSDYEASNDEAADDFIKYSLVNGAKTYIQILKERMGHRPAVISAGFKRAEARVCKYLGIEESDITATEFLFEEGRLKGIDFVLGERRVEAKNEMLEKRLGSRYGCYVIFDNDPILNVSTVKSGLNPSFIVGDFQKEQLARLGFDVFTCCPEARENLLNAVPPMNRFDYVLTAANILPRELIGTSFALSSNQRKLFEQLGTLDEVETRFQSVRDQFVALSTQILSIKRKYHLITQESDVSLEVMGLLVEKDDVKGKIKKVFEFFEANVPETNALEGTIQALQSLSAKA